MQMHSFMRRRVLSFCQRMILKFKIMYRVGHAAAFGRFASRYWAATTTAITTNPMISVEVVGTIIRRPAATSAAKQRVDRAEQISV